MSVSLSFATSARRGDKDTKYVWYDRLVAEKRKKTTRRRDSFATTFNRRATT